MTQPLDDLPLLHTRKYDTRVYLDGETLKVVGSVRDEKPPGLYIEDDDLPLDIHHMQVVLDVAVADLTITKAVVEFRTHPHAACPAVVEHYGKLVGLSVSRGFNRKVRELFGGPRACTHTTALLQAMAPVVIQSLWSMRVLQDRSDGKNPFAHDHSDRAESLEMNLNTCHVWADGGEHMTKARAGEALEAPVWIKDRYVELGRPLENWMAAPD